jgi:RalA-binding protein 1
MAGASATPPRRPHELPPPLSTARPPAPVLAMSSQVGPQLSLEAVLSAHAAAADPVMGALEQTISERNALASQNAQLWKLIEKSRGLYTESQRNLERVRLERDAYKAMLSKLGENPDAIARGHRARLKPSPSNNGIRQGSDGYPSPSPSAAPLPALPTRHQSVDTGMHRSIALPLMSSQFANSSPTLRLGCRRRIT